jgi:hypothetical protein
MRGLSFSKTANRPRKGGRWQATHEKEASRRQDGGDGTRHLHHRPNAAPVCRRSLANPLREQGAEASHTRETDFHADVGHGVLPHRQQVPGGVEACLDTKLVRRDAEDGIELPDEMKRRNLYLAREVRYRPRGLAQFP